MSVTITLDAREFTRTLQEYAKFRKIDDREAVADRAGKLSFELWKKFKAVTPSVAKLKTIAKRVGGRLKRRKGRTVEQELRRRIGARMTAASGWLPAVRRFSKSGKGIVLKKRVLRGSVSINLREPSVTITNDTLEGVKAEQKYRLMQKAIDAQTKDMAKYIQRKLEQRSRQLSAK